jgi:hypothetical protein
MIGESQYRLLSAHLRIAQPELPDFQAQDSRAVLRVGVPEENVILFEKWLGKEFRGDATSTLLQANVGE